MLSNISVIMLLLSINPLNVLYSLITFVIDHSFSLINSANSISQHYLIYLFAIIALSYHSITLIIYPFKLFILEVTFHNRMF